MAWFWLIINAIVLGLAGYAGWRLAGTGRARFYVALAAAALLLAVKSMLNLMPDVEQFVLGFSGNYIYLAGWDAPLAFLIAMSVACRFLSPNVRKPAMRSTGGRGIGLRRERHLPTAI